MKFITNLETFPWTCFPADLHTSGFIEVSTVESNWGKFLDPGTGRVHDCEKYFEQAAAAIEKN